MKLNLLIVLLFCTQITFGQNNRTNDYNNIGWYNYFGTFKVSDKIGVHSEYQWRRDEIISKPMQGLLRVGLNYKPNPRVIFRVGYAWIETYAYGAIPINGMGKSFTEHRIFEMVQLSHKEGILDFSHRFMLEQRFVGRYTSAALTTEDDYPLLHRMRYMIRLQMPLKGNVVKDKTPYIALYDELMIGFGKNVTANIFDQNRTGVLLGYYFNKHIRIDAGYLHQIAQLGRQINGNNVFQNNSGIILNTYFDF